MLTRGRALGFANAFANGGVLISLVYVLIAGLFQDGRCF